MKVYEAPEIKITNLLLNDIITNSNQGGSEEGKDEDFFPIV